MIRDDGSFLVTTRYSVSDIVACSDPTHGTVFLPFLGDSKGNSVTSKGNDGNWNVAVWSGSL